MTESAIQPFDKDHNPLAAVSEIEHRISFFIQQFGLGHIAPGVWEITPKEERRALLKHLYDHIRADEPKKRRFRYLREALEGIHTEQDFVALGDVDDFEGDLPMILLHYLPLYVDVSRGASRARFSSEAFHKRYLEIHAPDN